MGGWKCIWCVGNFFFNLLLKCVGKERFWCVADQMFVLFMNKLLQLIIIRISISIRIIRIGIKMSVDIIKPQNIRAFRLFSPAIHIF